MEMNVLTNWLHIWYMRCCPLHHKQHMIDRLDTHVN